MFLSQDEIQELTGLKYGARQIKWLRDHGITCIEGHDGKPKVLEDHIKEIMGARDIKQKRRKEPDFSMFENRESHVA